MADMLTPVPKSRPQTVDVVHRVEEGMRRWRLNTMDGRTYVDVRDAKILEDMKRQERRGGGGIDLSVLS